MLNIVPRGLIALFSGFSTRFQRGNDSDDDNTDHDHDHDDFDDSNDDNFFQ